MRTRCWIALHALVALAPMLGFVARRWDARVAQVVDVRLWGVELPPALPSLSFEDWQSEKTQSAFQRWFEARVGFRGAMVRTDNTIQTLVLGDAKPGSYVAVGEGGVPFAAEDFRYMGTPRRELPSILKRVEELTSRLGSVHRKLAKRGKQLVVVLSPSKTSVYPEAVPARWRRPGGERVDLDVHAALRAGLKTSGVPFGDAHALFTEAPRSARGLLFARGGRHWTSVGACLTLQAAFVGGPSALSCPWKPMPADRGYHGDFDLDCLENLWGTDVGWEHVPIAQLSPPLTLTPLPRLLLVGTSFMWMLADLLRPFVDKPVALFYNNTFFDLAVGRRLGTADATTPSWAEYVLERDLYVVDILETFAHHDEWLAFVTELDRRLD